MADSRVSLKRNLISYFVVGVIAVRIHGKRWRIVSEKMA